MSNLIGAICNCLQVISSARSSLQMYHYKEDEKEELFFSGPIALLDPTLSSIFLSPIPNSINQHSPMNIVM